MLFVELNHKQKYELTVPDKMTKTAQGFALVLNDNSELTP